ncbi:MAG: 30S ribosomal protein S20 [Candidatus Dojkabacteria bacterium]|nr:MAG: 30S ribosomal protein S20 [Candidatus Dojkabacteria bacterium]
MANIKASLKSIRRTKTETVYNSRLKNRYRRAIKKYNTLLEQNDFEAAQQYLPKVYKLLDKAAKRNIMNKNSASRKKSRLTVKLNRLSALDVEATATNS